MSSTDTQATFAVTTPIYYVNDLPHIGSAYTTIAADTIARFHRLRRDQVLMVTGTDEHGQKIQRTAEDLGRSPQEHCDTIVAGYKSLWTQLGIQYDQFIRTTSPRHEAMVQVFFQKLWDNGDVYLGQQQGWYCVSCEEFKEERELLDDHHCPLHPTKKVEWRDEQNYFFRLSKYQQALETFYAEHADFIQPESRRNEVLSFVKRGLQDFSISRVNVEWGIPLPVDPSHTIYVWFDALLNYLTAAVADEAEVTIENAEAGWWPVDLHLIGKDILRFHTVYWPAMLMSAELPIPDRVFVHGFLTKNGQKMSKSLGNIVDPVDLTNRYGADAVRYYFLKEIEFGRDGDFSETRFVNVLNADLANDLGNLLNRTLRMAYKYCDRKIPSINLADFSEDHLLKSKGTVLSTDVAQAYDRLAFNEAAAAVFSLVAASNKFLDEQAPWTRYKKGEQAAVEQILYAVLESVRQAAYLLSPIIPNLSTAVYQQLGFEQVDFNQSAIGDTAPYSEHAAWGWLPPGHDLGEAKPIFQRIELEPSA